MTRICTKCNIEKPISDFSIKKDGDGLRTDCKECRAKYLKEYRQKNKDKLLKQQSENHFKNREDRLKQQKEYRERNKDKISKMNRDYRNAHKNL